MNNAHFSHKKTEYVVEAFLFSLVLFEILVLVYYNLFHLDDIMDQDFAKLLRHAVEMGRNHTLFPANWDYLTTGEIDCAAVPAAIFYFLTKNAFLSYGLANILNILLCICVFHRLFSLAEIARKYILLFFALLFTTYDFGMLEYTNMLFFGGGQYVYKVLIPILFVVLLITPAEKRRQIRHCILLFIFMLLVLLTGISSGVYVFVCGLLPIIILEMVTLIKADLRKRRRQIFLMIVTVLLTILGIKLCSVLEISPDSSGMVLGGFEDIGKNLSDSFHSLLTVFIHPYGTDIPVFSKKGISILLNWVLACFIMTGFLFLPSLFRFFFLYQKEEKQTCGKAAIRLIAVTVWNFIILFLTIRTTRYQLIGAIPLMVCAVFGFSGWARNREHELAKYAIKGQISSAAMAVFPAVFILGFNLYSFRYSSQIYFESGTESGRKWNTQQSGVLSDFLDRFSVDTCIFVNSIETVEFMKAYDYERVYENLRTETMTITNYDFYYTTRDRSAFSDKNIILAREEDFSTLPEYITQGYTQVGTVLGYNAWFSEENPIDGTTQVFRGTTVTDLPSSPGYSVNGTLDGKGYLRVDKTNGSAGDILLTSPIISIGQKNAVYTMRFETEFRAELRIISDEKVSQVLVLDPGSSEVTAELKDAGDYQFELVRQGSGEITIKEITIQTA